MREKTIENYLRDEVRLHGGIALKLTTPSGRGWPDRLVLMPRGQVTFVECKAPGKKPTKLQEFRINFLKGLGFIAIVIDSKGGVDDFILST